MTMYRFVDDKVVCMNNAINILTRLLETIFKVVGADELMDGICIVVMKAQVPRLKLQLQMIDYYYEEEESKQGVFESVKLRIRSMIAFIKNCRFSDFCKLDSLVWEKYMGRSGEGLSRHRRNSELSSDDMPEPETPAEEEGEPSTHSTITSDSHDYRNLFEKKTKKIVEGKWRECLDPKPKWAESNKTNDRLVLLWKSQRYRFYKTKPVNEQEESELYDVGLSTRVYHRNIATLSELLKTCFIWSVRIVFVKEKRDGGKTRSTNQMSPFQRSTNDDQRMSQKIALKPRTYFLKRQNTFLGGRSALSSQGTTSRGTKESIELKDYAEKMIREQKLSSQKLNQLVWDMWEANT